MNTALQARVLVLFLYCFFKSVDTIDGNDEVKVWGPGLRPNVIIMPARYFFVQTPASDNEDLLSVEIKGTTPTSRACRIWTNVLKCGDGFYIVRYKVYETCSSVQFNVEYNTKSPSGFPLVIDNFVSADDCYCPRGDLGKFASEWKCGGVPKQIISDLRPFEEINWDNIRDKVITKFNQPTAVSLCHYVIKENKIYRKCYGQYVGYKMFMDNILLSLSRKVYLPDLEFFVNLGDWPLVKNDSGDVYPIFSWCGSKDTADIIMPTHDITESTLENMGRVMLDVLSVQGNNGVKWEEKTPKVFWRGRDSNRFRLKLINISREHPDLFNVSLTNFFFFRNEEELYGPKAPHESFFKFFDYKYQLNIDGTVAAYRFPYLLAGGSLVFKQDSKYYEHFYADLIPDYHFVPIRTDLSDLVEKITWAIKNDEKAKQIAMNGRKFVNANLLPKDIFCYHAHLLREFKKKTVGEVNVLDGMEEVRQTQQKHCECFNGVKDEL